MRPEALAALAGCDLIIHAGDVGNAGVLQQLHTVGPVVAIRGNVDIGPWTAELPAKMIVEAGSTLLYVLHDVQELDLDPVAAGFHLIVSGHSHKPGHYERSGICYVNPGSAGPRRFRLPVTVARLQLSGASRDIEFIDLS